MRLSTITGAVATALVLFLTLGTLGIVALRAEGAGRLTPSDWAAIRFTVVQAAISAALSILLAIPVARALARRQFPLRSLLVTLLGAPFVLPVIVAVLGLLAVFGRNGVVSQALGLFGFEPLSIYGFHGVILAHVFFNLPLATRFILQGWTTIPSERLRLAASLGFRPLDTFRHLEWPMLRAVVPGAFLVIFLICTTSFAVALTLGGGPRATTVELAIYQAFRFDFDLGKAALLGLIQFAIGATAAALAFSVTRISASAPGIDRPMQFWGVSGQLLRVQDATAILLVGLFLVTPLAMVLIKGIPQIISLPAPVYDAMLRSILIALSSAVLTLFLAGAMAILATRLRRGQWIEAVGYVSIAASPLVIGTGLFILIFPFFNPVALALPITAVVNAVMALPFALRTLTPALAQVETDFGKLADSLGIKGWARLRLVILPRLRRPIGFALGLAAALSMGDLGVIALFGDPERATLPLQMYRLMASYRVDDAAGAAVLLLGCALALFWVFDRGGRMNADT